ncbi:acyltransferase [Mycoplasmatota bacterium]|nr:acyltransferase [Mycoplasmatota bacterium]
MIYDIIFILTILFLVKKVRLNKSYTEVNDVLSQNNSIKIKGFFSVIIVLHHLSLFTDMGLVFSCFSILGIESVGVFFFISGYGLMTQYINKEDYLESFIKKRIPKLLFPYIITIVIYIFFYNITGEVITTFDVILSLFNGEPIVAFSWYVLATLVFYIIFYIIALLFQRSYNMIIVSMFLGMVVYAIICIILGYGYWWYSSCFTFVIGMFWAVYKNKFQKFFSNNSKRFIFYLISGITLCLLGLVVSYFFSGYSISELKATPTLGDKILGKPLSILCLQLITIFSCVMILLVFNRKSPNNKLWEYLGSISYEIYLSHGIVMYIFRNNNLFIENDFVFVCVVLLGTLVLGGRMQNINLFIWEKYCGIICRNNLSECCN